MYCKLSSRHYRRSPLVQGGLEIQKSSRTYFTCNSATIKTIWNFRYMELVTDLYIEPVKDRAVGNLFNMTLTPVVNNPPVLAQNRKKYWRK